MIAKFKETKHFSEKFPKPFDYLVDAEGLRETPYEDYVCFWVSQMVEEAMYDSNRYLSPCIIDHPITDAPTETFEDRYFQVLYDLYFFNLPSCGKE